MCSSDLEAVAASLILKNQTNPFFVAMAEGAKKAAAENGVDLTIGAGKDDTDVQGQITAIENAVAQGQKGILITPAGPGVNDAITAARQAGRAGTRGLLPKRLRTLRLRPLLGSHGPL